MPSAHNTQIVKKMTQAINERPQVFREHEKGRAPGVHLSHERRQ
jgi:hypothetical protein